MLLKSFRIDLDLNFVLHFGEDVLSASTINMLSAALSLALLFPFSQAPVYAQNSPQSLGAIKPSNLSIPKLGVFASGNLANSVGKIVANDLDLGDIAAKASGDAAYTAAQNAEAQAGSSGDPQYTAWAGAGIAYLLRTRDSGNGCDAELFDIIGRKRLLGRRYSGASLNEVAHKIADDCMTAITTFPGIFSSKIAFVSGGNNLIVMDADGGNKRTVASDGKLLSTPTWGDRGTEIYYTGYANNNPDLMCATLSGSVRTVSSAQGLNSSPNWCQNAGKIALSMSKDGNPEIYSMGKTGLFPKRLTNDPGVDTAPAWKPDGSAIAFTSDRGGSPQIYLMSAGGGGAQKISIGGYCDSAAFSPDGKKLAYICREKGEFNIYMADLSTGALTQLTSGTGKNEDPSWAPSSNHIVFQRGSGVYIMNVNTKKAKDLGAPGAQPVWGPLSN